MSCKLERIFDGSQLSPRQVAAILSRIIHDSLFVDFIITRVRKSS